MIMRSGVAYIFEGESEESFYEVMTFHLNGIQLRLFVRAKFF
jgi:hypothetical protein